VIVPLDAGHLAGFAAYAGRHVNKLGYFKLALNAATWRSTGMAGD
jgi:hypothetical protein